METVILTPLLALCSKPTHPEGRGCLHIRASSREQPGWSTEGQEIVLYATEMAATCQYMFPGPNGSLKGECEKAQRQQHRPRESGERKNSRLIYLAMGRNLYTLPATRHSDPLTLCSRPSLAQQDQDH
ncbi:hypothetical protein H671_4g12789 [Cricetulus griseus]|nr:hypothetical protein H671_4g12789 [Cricetulus griseus]